MSYPLTAGKGTVEPTDAGRARKTPRAGQCVRGAEDILVGHTPPPHRSLGLSLEASTEAGTGSSAMDTQARLVPWEKRNGV